MINVIRTLLDLRVDDCPLAERDKKVLIFLDGFVVVPDTGLSSRSRLLMTDSEREKE